MARACSHAFATFLRLIPSSSSQLKRRMLFSNRTPLCFQPLRLFRGGKAFHEVRRGGGESIVTPVRRRLGGVRAAQVNESGSIDSPMMQSMETKIKEELSADAVTVKDAYGDGRHVSIYVVSSAFEGQSSVNRQRMVYKVIWEELQSTVHAVDQMITRTPAEAEENQ